MGGLRDVAPSARQRVRRWDAIVLGGALPGLVTAARLGMEGLRVLVVEEDASARAFPGLREPFFLAGGRPGGALDACLHALTIPLIERRRLELDPIAYQLVLPDARIDVGEAPRTVDELVAWGFAKPGEATELCRMLVEASLAEGEALLSYGPTVQRPRGAGFGEARREAPRARLSSHSPKRAPRFVRGLPVGAAAPSAAVAPLLEAQLRALCNLAETAPPPEARARLLGVPLEGGIAFGGGDPGLRELLRRRIRSVYGEFRSVSGPFELVEAAGNPGIALQHTGDVWIGRTLILNAPRAALARALKANSPGSLLSGPTPTRLRLRMHFRVRREVLPEGMARRVIRVADPAQPMDGVNVVTFAVFPDPGADDVDLVASAVVRADEDQRAAREAEIEAALRSLMPFSNGRLSRAEVKAPVWDDDVLLSDPAPGRGWPAEIDIRVSARPSIHALDREGVAALGLEGELLLGWRATDVIRSELR